MKYLLFQVPLSGEMSASLSGEMSGSEKRIVGAGEFGAGGKQ